jgi:hypothetical protein
LLCKHSDPTTRCRNDLFIKAGTRMSVEAALLKKLTTCSPIDEEYVNSEPSREIKRGRSILVENA